MKKKLLTSLEAQEKYIKKFEHFNESKEEIPFEIKTIVACIKDKIKDETTSFSKPFDFSNYEYFPIKFNLEVSFTFNDNISQYKSEIDTLCIMRNGINNIFDIPISIIDGKIDISKIISICNHELRHIYDLLCSEEDYDTNSFFMNPAISKIRKKYPDFEYFINLIYLSLEHELVARNSMLYDELRHLNIFDKIILWNKVKETKSYEYLKMLENFDYIKYINKFDKNQLFTITNDIINIMNLYRESKIEICRNNNDVINFYKKWGDIFKNKAKEYINYINNIIEDVITDIRPYNENCVFNRLHTYTCYSTDINNKINYLKLFSCLF